MYQQRGRHRGVVPVTGSTMLLTENEDTKRGVCWDGEGEPNVRLRGVCLVVHAVIVFTGSRRGGVDRAGKTWQTVHCVIVWTVPHRVPTQEHTDRFSDYIIIFWRWSVESSVKKRDRLVVPKGNKSLFGGCT
jgi:hypothetical protein